MSIYIQADNDDEPTFLASNTGWGNVVTWVEGTAMFNLKQFVEKGMSNKIPMLITELKTIPLPTDANTAATVRELFDFLNASQDADAIVIC